MASVLYDLKIFIVFRRLKVFGLINLLINGWLLILSRALLLNGWAGIYRHRFLQSDMAGCVVNSSLADIAT